MSPRWVAFTQARMVTFEVIISQQVPTYFMPVLGIYDMTISARAVLQVD